ncbi:DotU family type IV/VI secretion system protein [Pseudomonas sp. B6002]|uniref:type IVB secretion system protein IcmH/DotU n=1 Tax=Pseudomonas sp. B6002 TaxID=2726978 RepID=UPI0015A4936B|nr:type IVB secretion system protein IcmH/DotU [Pseudomonas sp. B6002]NVZ50494.1 DotU family type IV/VI secretion system protein [Pseudomonas sp. B6002]
MNKDSEYPQDEKTVLLDREGHGPAQGPLTDFVSTPRFEQLEDRMIYAAALHDAHPFNVGPSTLVSASWEVLSEVVQLKLGIGRENTQPLNDRLGACIARFETRAAHEGVESSQVKYARYVLCSVLDEAVVTTTWGNHSDWSKVSLLSRFHNETFGGEKFFQVLDRLSRDPVKHLAMLELMYLCLALGFEGKYRVMTRGTEQLEAVRDALYRQIKHVRGDPPLLRLPPSAGKARRRRWPLVSATGFAVLGVFMVLALYSVLTWVLGQQRADVLQRYQSSAPVLTRATM